MNKNYFPKNLRYLRSKRGMEQLELATMLGRKSASSISEWEKGSYTPKAGVLSDIARIFNIDLSDLMDKDLSSDMATPRVPDTSQIPLVGTIAAGSPLLAEENIDDYFAIDSRVKADFCLRIKGRSMINAGIYENDIVFIRKQESVENGEIAAILIDNEATLKRFYKNEDTVVLQAENEAFDPMFFTNGNIRVLGKLVAVLNIRE